MGTQQYSRTYYTDAPLDGTDAGANTLETTVTEGGVDRRFQPLIARATVVESEHVAVGPIISMGTNSPNYNNLVSAQTIGGIVGELLTVNLQDDVPELAEGTEIKCKVITAAIPTLGHSAVFTFHATLHGLDRLYSE